MFEVDHYLMDHNHDIVFLELRMWAHENEVFEMGPIGFGDGKSREDTDDSC
jgi:hypothetical protein